METMNSNRDKKSFQGFWSHHQLFFFNQIKIFIVCYHMQLSRNNTDSASVYLYILPSFPQWQHLCKTLILHQNQDITDSTDVQISDFNYTHLCVCIIVIQHSLYCCYLVIKSCLTPSIPMDVARQAPLSRGFSKQAHQSWLPFPAPGNLPDPGIKPMSPTLQADYLPLSHQGSPAYISDLLPVIPT